MHASESSALQNRRGILQMLGGIGVGSLAFQRALATQVAATQSLTNDMIAQAEWIADIELQEQDRQSVAEAVGRLLKNARELRQQPVDADTVPALVFRPDFFYGEQTPKGTSAELQVSYRLDKSEVAAPTFDTELGLAFASVRQQATLLANKRVSSEELTTLYLTRLQRYDPVLKCVVTMLEELALKQARASDERRANGQQLGILDGIPWVAKDLIAIPPWKTTWGAEPFKTQVREQEATVSRLLREAGAVLLAKVSLGALAWGDKWFGGRTNNPWNIQQGSSGSSAGSAAAVSAGLASFALGSETLGSIVSPTRRCRTCGLRPTFGSVSRAGCMPLAWSMDKMGPITRHVDDLAYVFAAIMGTDGKDPTLVSRGFQWPVDQPITSLRVGVGSGRMNSIERRALELLEAEGAQLVDLELESDLPVSAMGFILGVEASTVFDDAFRHDSQADYGRWPGTFRESQFVPAIQYLRANRIRTRLIRETQKQLASVDVVIGADDLLLTNLTGHPSLVVSCGSDREGELTFPGVVKLTAAAYQEAKLLSVANFLQQRMPPLPSHPPLEKWLAEQPDAPSEE